LNIEHFCPNIQQNQNFKKIEKLRQALWYCGKPLMSEISWRLFCIFRSKVQMGFFFGANFFLNENIKI
jgi:hypothetical protein